MNRSVKLAAVISLMIFIVGPGWTQSEADATNIKATVQMPIAVSKAVDAGARPDHVEQLAKEMVEGDVEGEEFNGVMQRAPGISQEVEASSDEKGISDYVEQKKSEGLRGKQLANSIHEELNRRGIPAGGAKGEGKGMSPMDEDFVPPGLKNTGKSGQAGRPGTAKEARGRPDHAGSQGGEKARGKQGKHQGDKGRSSDAGPDRGADQGDRPDDGPAESGDERDRPRDVDRNRGNSDKEARSGNGSRGRNNSDKGSRP